ncbi:uncharacterized protein ISCGN_025155 [Ixodes scapularis]
MEYASLLMLLVAYASKSAEPAVDSGLQTPQPGQSSTSESAFGGAQRAESKDFQNGALWKSFSDALISSGRTDRPAQSEAIESSDDPKNLDKLSQVANNGGPGHLPRNASLNEDGGTEPSDALLQAHDTLSVVHIFAHREPIPSSHASSSEVFGDPTEKNLSPKHQLRLPAFGPFPPNYASDPHGPRCTRRDVTRFFCDFEEHNCGMRNQKNIPGHFNRESNGLANRRGHYLVVHAKSVRYNVSRIITPYLPGYPRAKACLSFSYVIHGGGASRIEVIAQDTANHHLFRLKQDGSEWRNIQYTMNVRQDVRFFIEAYTTGRAEGVIAIDNFGFNLAPCPKY